MPIFEIKDSKLNLVNEIQFSLEKDIQKLTEASLETVFNGLEFVASEFNLENFWLDTLAFNPETQAFVVIEYKKKQNISIMDQGQTYLNLLLDHKAEVLLEYNEQKNKSLKRKDIDWGQTRVMFIAPDFTSYQKRALHPKLPFELWEVKKYDNNIISYNRIQPLILARTGQPVSSLAGRASKEIKVYTREDVLGKSSLLQKEIIEELIETISALGDDIQEVVGKDSISYKAKKSFVCVWPQKKEKGITISFQDGYKLEDKKGILKGRGERGRYTKINSLEEIGEITDYIKQAYEKAK